jgi:hypothetical protein
MAKIHISKELWRYLEKNKLKNLDSITPHQIKNIFITAIADFKSGKLPLDSLSDIAGSLAHTLLKEKGLMKTELFQTLEKCAELEWEVRHITAKDEGNFIRFMKEVDNYFGKYKK